MRQLRFISDEFPPILGGRADVPGACFADLWKDGWGQLAPVVQSALAGRTVAIKDHALVVDRGQGTERAWFTLSRTPVQDGAGKVLGVMKTAVETTKRHLARAERETAQQRLRGVLQAMAEVIALLGPDSTFLDVNAETLRLDGRPVKQLIDRSHCEAYAESEASPIGDLLRRVMRNASRDRWSIESTCPTTATRGSTPMHIPRRVADWRFSGAT